MPNKAHSQRHQIDLGQIARDTMLAEGFHPDIPAAVEAEVERTDQLKTISQSSARDLRQVLWSSIDNKASRDLDQIEYVERMAGDQIKVLIGIADVDAFVPKGSVTDDHARDNTTSVYAGVETFPMLPEALSTDKTSLVEEQDRLAIIIEFRVGPDGVISRPEVFQGLVRNKSKMSYERIGKWLDENNEIPVEVSKVPGLEEQVRLQFDVAQRLHESRRRQGALTLDTRQVTPLIDDNQQIVGLASEDRNRAKDLIEDFMVAANAVMAELLDRRGIVSLRRVVRTPENWPRIQELAAESGYALPREPEAFALSQFLERQRKSDPDHFPDLSLAIVKLLGPGDYVVHVPGEETDGHFGLAVHRYTHSTAPNRRYADLITQRLIKSASSPKPAPYSVTELETLATHCNDRESAARKVERKMRKVAAAVFMTDRIGEEFNAIVTGVTAKGTFARIIKPPVDGMLVKHQHGLKVGQHIRVKLLSTDPYKGYLDFAVLRL